MIKEQLNIRLERPLVQILRVWISQNKLEDEKKEWEDRELIEIAKKEKFKSTTVSGIASELLEEIIRQKLR